MEALQQRLLVLSGISSWKRQTTKKKHAKELVRVKLPKTASKPSAQPIKTKHNTRTTLPQ